MTNKQNKNNRIHYYPILVRLTVVTIILYLIASLFDVYERFKYLLIHYEAYNIDELILVGVLMSLWLMGELIVLAKKLHYKSNALECVAKTDSLTGLYNRRGFF